MVERRNTSTHSKLLEPHELDKIVTVTLAHYERHADGNVLIFAFVQSASTSTLESLEATAEELQIEFALEFPRFLRRLRMAHPSVTSASIMRALRLARLLTDEATRTPCLEPRARAGP